MGSEQVSMSRSSQHPSSPSHSSHPVPPASPLVVPVPPTSASESIEARRQLTSPRPSGTSVSSAPPLHTSHPQQTRKALISFSFLFPNTNTSSTSLAASTAEGKPIPLDNSTAEHRTSALREININFPSPVSRHQIAKSTGAQSSTYSQPVIVRTYSGPIPSQQAYSSRKYRPPSTSRPGVRRIPLPVAPVTGTHLSSTTAPRPSESVSAWTARQNDPAIASTGPPRSKRKMPWQWGSASNSGAPEVAKLPPREAFLCKTFLAALEEKEGGQGIGSDLDRLAEICARSRYSLSNRYEVHVAPHGSGASFLASATMVPAGGRRRGKRHHRNQPGDLTLQAVASDDESSSTKSYRKRRDRGKSMAHTTLETIMQSSRSSEEEKRKKKSAAEIKEEVRGRAARNQSDHSGTTAQGSGRGSGVQPPSTNAAETSDANDVPDQSRKRHSGTKSASFASAVMDNTWQASAQGDRASPRNSAAALISQPALPQSSTSHLEIRTAADLAYDQFIDEGPGPGSPHSSHGSDEEPPLTGSTSYAAEPDEQMTGALSGLRQWVPWQSDPVDGSNISGRPSQAVGSLRQLLQTVDRYEGKGKGVAHCS